MRAVMRRAAFLVTASAGAGVLVAGMVVTGAGPAAAAGQVLYAYAGGTGSPAGCPQDTASPPVLANDCGLGEALTQATAGDTIDLATPGGTAHYVGNWTINTPGTSPTVPVTIQAAAGLATQPVLDGNNGVPSGCTTGFCHGPVLAVPSGEAVSLSGITIANGSNIAFVGGSGLDNAGDVTITGCTFTGNTNNMAPGAIANRGSLTVTASTFTGNSALDGGAIASSGSLTVTASTFSGNSAGGGGAIWNGDGGTATVIASTFSGNTAGAGGAIDNGPQGSGTLTVIASTFTGNTATNGGAIDGGDNSGGGTVRVAGDVFDGSCHQAGGTWEDFGYNAGSDNTCYSSPTPPASDLTSPAPPRTLGLGSLATNGGPTQTIMPVAGSAVIGLIPASGTGLCPATDQRGYASAANTACDAGAVQTSGSAPALTTTPDPAQVRLGTSPLNDTATLSGGISPTGTITFTLHDPNNTVVYTDHVPVHGSGTYATTDASGDNPGGFTPTTLAGTWQWDASYSGDTANGPLSDTSDPAERVTVVAKASPGITSASGGTGTALSDSATLTGGNDPGGTITFTLYDPASTVAYTDVVTVSGDGTYSTAAGNNPGGFQPTTAGTYQWVAAYSGDDSNNAAATSNGDEPQTVYGSGGFMSPLPKTTLQKAGSTIPVKFRLTTAAGQPISSSVAAALAAAGAVKATLTGPTPGATKLCTWNTTSLLFQCNIKTPSGLLTGKTHPYQITVYENVGGGFVQAPGTANPETIYFK